LIQTIVFKDIHGSLKFLMMLFFFGVILAMVLSPIARSAPDHDVYLEELVLTPRPQQLSGRRRILLQIHPSPSKRNSDLGD